MPCSVSSFASGILLNSEYATISMHPAHTQQAEVRTLLCGFRVFASQAFKSLIDSQMGRVHSRGAACPPAQLRTVLLERGIVYPKCWLHHVFQASERLPSDAIIVGDGKAQVCAAFDAALPLQRHVLPHGWKGSQHRESRASARSTVCPCTYSMAACHCICPSLSKALCRQVVVQCMEYADGVWFAVKGCRLSKETASTGNSKHCGYSSMVSAYSQMKV